MSFEDPKVFPLKSCTIVEMSKARRKVLFNLNTTSILYSSSQWIVRAPDQYYTSNWKQIFQSIQTTKVKKLVLDLNRRPTILKHILNIQFTDLKELWLHGNHIQNIEPLSFISMDKLQCLSLSENHISNANPLAKCKFSELTHIYLEKNNFLKFNRVERSPFKKMSQFVLEWEKKDPVVLQDISVLAKIKVKTKAIIRLKGRKRILEQKVYNCLAEGFDECSILISQQILGVNLRLQQ